MAALGAVAAAIFLWPAFLASIRRPRLEILVDEGDPVRPISLYEGLGEEPIKQFVRFWVRNSGPVKAENVRVFARAVASSSKCDLPSTTKRRLLWEGFLPAYTLGAHGGEESVLLAFTTDVERFGHGRNCGETGKKPRMVAYLATRNSCNAEWPVEADGFCPGVFDIELTAQAYDGTKTTALLRLTVAWSLGVHQTRATVALVSTAAPTYSAA